MRALALLVLLASCADGKDLYGAANRCRALGADGVVVPYSPALVSKDDPSCIWLFARDGCIQ